MADDAQDKVKRPAFQFYPADWRKDVELQSCSMAAQGLWINALCIAHQCTPYGHLTVNGKAMTVAQLGRHVGLSAREADHLVAELEDAGVARRTAEGVIFSKRMVEDESLRMVRAAGGTAGAEYGKKGAKDGFKGGRPKKEKGGSQTPLTGSEEPPPSSSSSSSPSSNSEPNGSGGRPPMPPDEIIFGYGLSMLVNAGTPDKQARSFLGGLRKAHGDIALIDKLRECAKAKVLQPLEWLAAALPPGGVKAAPNKQEALEERNRSIAAEWAAEGQNHAAV
jgi:hypothetical protein